MDNIEHLYKCYDILSEAGENIKDYVDEYKDILKAVSGSSKEKRLASQFIGKFFKFFPELTETAIDAQLDLCEDHDSQIRRQAIKDLPKLCQDNTEITIKVGDTLAQLLPLVDAAEVQHVENSLQCIIKMNAKASLTGIFAQIQTGDELTREHCLKFLKKKFLPMGATVVTKEIEDMLIQEVKNVLEDVTGDEFKLAMSILGSTKLGTTVTGHLELVNLAKDQADLNADINALTIDDDSVNRFIQCAQQVMSYFSNTIKTTDFITFVCDKLFPIDNWNSLTTILTYQDQVKLRLLKVFAEMCNYCDKLEKDTERLTAVYTILREYMPLPEINNYDVPYVPPSFDFSHAECLLYALHTLGKKNVDALSQVLNADNLKDFRARLQYLARGTQAYMKILEEQYAAKKEHTAEEKLIHDASIRTCSNISYLIRDLFQSPPVFKHRVQLSWIVPKNKSASKRASTGALDTKSTTNENGGNKRNDKRPRQIYSPPSGKYSAKVKNYNGSSSGHSRGGRNRNNSSSSGGNFKRNRHSYGKNRN